MRLGPAVAVYKDVPEVASLAEAELLRARAAHADALAKGDRRAIADAAVRIWRVLSRQPRYAWLLRPAGR